MTRNAKTYGILTTLSGWCFAFRNDGARLLMTRMFGFGPEAAAEYRQSEITIMMGLYYLSRIAQETANTPETTQRQGGSVLLPFADADRTTAAPIVKRILPPAQPAQPPPPASSGQDNWNMYRLCRFEPWIKENQLGVKSWIVEFLPDHVKAVLKLWEEDDDSKKCNEVRTYKQLEPLWGKCIPSFVVGDIWEHSNSIVLEYIDVSSIFP